MRYAFMPFMLASSLLLGQAPRFSESNTPVPAWPEGAVTTIESPGLAMDVRTPGFTSNPGLNGYRMMHVVVMPGEKLDFNLKAEDDKLLMVAFVPKPTMVSFDWRMALRTFNDCGYPCRKTITNTTQDPQSLVLILLGAHDYPYQVKLVRS